MNDEHAKQSTDDISRQNMAREEDLHAALLNSSNPAFHTLTSMGIKGEIKPGKDKKVVKENVDEIPDIDNKVRDERASSEEVIQVRKSTELSKKEDQRKDQLKLKKKKKNKKSRAKSKNKQKSEGIGSKSKKSADVKRSSHSSRQKQFIDGNLMYPEELSQFSQWLTAIGSPIAPELSNVEGDELNKKTAPVEPQRASPAATLPQIDLPETEPVTRELKKKRKKKRKSRSKNKKVKRGAYESEVILSDDIFSETLADLLAIQGHKKQAILMYEKLGLIYPEKSRFFAAKIEELNKK